MLRYATLTTLIAWSLIALPVTACADAKPIETTTAVAPASEATAKAVAPTPAASTATPASSVTAPDPTASPVTADAPPEPEAKAAEDASTGPGSEAPRSAWSRQTTPAPGTPRAIGEYSSGCVRGAQELPLHGPGYEVMHPSRARHFGHPDLIELLKRLGRSVEGAKLAPMLLGDLSQPRGGRALGGHASHQTGLDVDIWYWAPKQVSRKGLPMAQRESLKARSILDGKAEAIAVKERDRVRTLLQLTASEDHVARIFVHPWIKRELCATTGPSEPERAWLAKVRPWFGHDDHFHVRLACPKSSPDCVAQVPPPPGDGCDELDYWLGDKAKSEREKGRKEYVQKVLRTPQLPAACAELLK